jgi:hypothetical protein
MPVEEYSANLAGTVVSINPILLVVLSSNLTGDNLTTELSNFTNTSLISVKPQGEHYLAVYNLTSSDAMLNVLTGLVERNVTLLQYGFPATVDFPHTFIATRGGKEYNLTITASDDISAIVTGTSPGEQANFTLDIVKTGDKKKIVAVETI